jgi:inosine-uridine nucleoside N-ribohydrolase
MASSRLTRRRLLSVPALALAASGNRGRASQAGATQGGVRAVLDTDTYNEIDDQFAVAYALLSPDAMTVEAIYAAPFHNDRSAGPGDGMEKSYQEILRVLEALGDSRRDFVYRGSKRFLPGAFKPVDSPAARDLIQRALASREERLYVVAVGAPTNVASAILMEPRIKEKILVVWLGGQPYDSGSAREFNLQQDPHASRVLFDTGIRLVNIPTRGVSDALQITTPELERAIRGKSRIGDYLFGIFAEYEKQHHKDPAQPWSKVIWDIAAVAWVIDPGWVDTTMVPSPILTEDLRWRHNPERHGVRVATRVDRDAVFADLFRKLTSAA